MKNLFLHLSQDDSGQTMTEYALILAVIAVVVVGVMTLMGTEISQIFQGVTDTLSGS